MAYTNSFLTDMNQKLADVERARANVLNAMRDLPVRIAEAQAKAIKEMRYNIAVIGIEATIEILQDNSI